MSMCHTYDSYFLILLYMLRLNFTIILKSIFSQMHVHMLVIVCSTAHSKPTHSTLNHLSVSGKVAVQSDAIKLVTSDAIT